MAPDGSGLTSLTMNAPSDHSPAWAPGGKRLALSTNRNGTRDIHVVNADGTALTNLTVHPSEDVSPAGTK